MSDFRVLHVCTGNICRSPMAERVMRSMLEQELPDAASRFLVESAGTWGHDGAGMEPEALETLQYMGIDGNDFLARELLAEHVGDADLVLTATREHRAAVVSLEPRASTRTFTLREFARLLAGLSADALPDHDPVDRAHALVRLAAQRRGTVPPVTPHDDDVPDPYRGPASGFERTRQLIEDALQVPIGLLHRSTIAR